MKKSQQNQVTTTNRQLKSVHIHLRQTVCESLQSINKRKAIEENIKSAFVEGVHSHLCVLDQSDIDHISVAKEETANTTTSQFAVVVPQKLYQSLKRRSATYEASVESTVNHFLKKGNKAIQKQKEAKKVTKKTSQ
jgi:hypothetical protein